MLNLRDYNSMLL